MPTTLAPTRPALIERVVAITHRSPGPGAGSPFDIVLSPRQAPAGSPEPGHGLE